MKEIIVKLLKRYVCYANILFYTLLSGNADSKNHGTRVILLSACLLASHYYSHYEHEGHYEYGAQVPSLN